MVSLSKSLKNNSTNILLVLLVVLVLVVAYNCLGSSTESFFFNNHRNGGCYGFGHKNATVNQDGDCVHKGKVIIPSRALIRMIQRNAN